MVLYIMPRRSSKISCRCCHLQSYCKYVVCKNAETINPGDGKRASCICHASIYMMIMMYLVSVTIGVCCHMDPVVVAAEEAGKLEASATSISPPFNVQEFPWWTLPIPSRIDGMVHYPIVNNLFLLLKATESSCINCTLFVSLDTALDAVGTTGPESPVSMHLLQYQAIPFHMPFRSIAHLPTASRIPSLVNGSYLLVTDGASASSTPQVFSPAAASSSSSYNAYVTINYQRILAHDLFVSQDMVVHGITGFLSPFNLGIPFPPP